MGSKRTRAGVVSHTVKLKLHEQIKSEYEPLYPETRLSVMDTTALAIATSRVRGCLTRYTQQTGRATTQVHVYAGYVFQGCGI